MFVFAGCEKKVFDNTAGKQPEQNTLASNQNATANTADQTKTQQTKTVKPIVFDFVDAVVKGESGSMYVYLERNADFLKLYPKMSGSFNMWDLDYYLDLQTAGKLYKNVNIKTDRNDGGRSVGDLVYVVKTGSTLQIEKKAWDDYVSGKVKYLLPKSVRAKSQK